MCSFTAIAPRFNQHPTKQQVAESVEAVEYTDFISAYDTKQSYGEAPVKLELYGICSTPSWPLLPGAL